MNIVITAGGTQEKIDSVRSITNTATGKTAYGLAEFLFRHEYKNIYYIHSHSSLPYLHAKENISFISSDDLDKSLKHLLGSKSIDVVIHNAAVSDFIVDKVVINGELFDPKTLNKISSRDEVEIILKQRSKIIEKLKEYSMKHHPLVIGFKLTKSPDELDQKEQALKLSMSKNIDFVVQNDLSKISPDFHKTKIYFKDNLMFSGETKEDLYKNIKRILELYTFNKNHFNASEELV